MLLVGDKARILSGLQKLGHSIVELDVHANRKESVLELDSQMRPESCRILAEITKPP